MLVAGSSSIMAVAKNKGRTTTTAAVAVNFIALKLETVWRAKKNAVVLRLSYDRTIMMVHGSSWGVKDTK
jgi:hypothetical protein